MAWTPRIRIALGADIRELPSSWAWTDITTYVKGKVRVSRGKPSRFSTTPPSTLHCVLDNTDGRFSATNRAGPYFGQIAKNTPIDAAINPGSGYVTRYTGFINGWPVRYRDGWRHVPISASGHFRRLDQGETFRSALYRANSIQVYSTSAVATQYWPCEDPFDSIEISSGVDGAPAAVYERIDLSSESMLGSDPLMSLQSNSYFLGAVPEYAASDEWVVSCVLKLPESPGATSYLLGWNTEGTQVLWRFGVIPGSPDMFRVFAYNSAGTEMLSDPGIDLETNAVFYDRQLFFRLEVSQSGSDIAWSYFLYNGLNGGTGNSGTVGSSTVGNVTSFGINGTDVFADATIGHIGTSGDANFHTGVGTQMSLGFGYESSTTRFIRLNNEEDVPYLLPGFLGGGGNSLRETWMAEQRKASLIELYREVERAEHGLIFESKTSQPTFLTRAFRYNVPVDLTLSFADSDIKHDFDPEDDDQDVLSDVEVQAINGPSGRYVNTAHIEANHGAVYKERRELSLFTTNESGFNYEHQIPRHHAAWIVHEGTSGDLRYPQVHLNLAHRESLLADWLGCDIGSRIVINDPPDDLPPDDIHLLIEGYTEEWSKVQYDAWLNLSDAWTWEVEQVETGGSTIVHAIDDNDTSFKVATSVSREWSDEDEPYLIIIDGEAMKVTACADNTPAFIAAGVVAHGNNASVSPGLPAGMTVDTGQALLGWAAIRNSGTGTVDLPAGYRELSRDGNVLFFGKYYVTGDAAPTITFTGGAAGADTSARLFAFSGLSLELDDGKYRTSTPSPQEQLNGSAQDIAFPALSVRRHGAVVFILAWKQDDWTSVATPSSMDAEIMDNATTTGNDQGVAAYYDIQTNATDLVAGSLVVTGGAAAISRAITVALRPLQTFTVERSVNGQSGSIAAGEAIETWRTGVLAL